MSNTDEQEGRDIPLPIQREVRQRCGFGCVICGMPLYEYEHMLEWAQVKRHVAEEITLLCDQHHREKTSGLLSVEMVKQADSNPFNFRAGVSKPYDLHYSGDACEVNIGGNRFSAAAGSYGSSMAALVIDDVPMLGFVMGDGHLLLHLNLFDEANRLILRIANNWLVYSVSPWDIRLVGRRLEIREGQGRFLIEIEFRVPNEIVISRGRFLYNGVEVVVNPDYALITNNRTLLSENSAIGCANGLVLGTAEQESGAMIRISDISRYSEENRKQAIKWADGQMNAFEAGGGPGAPPLDFDLAT
jgi:hypothetical protein